MQFVFDNTHLLSSDSLTRIHFEPFFTNHLYRIFMHQAVLAGVVLSSFSHAQLHELPESYNYPLHLHGDYPLEFRPRKLDPIQDLTGLLPMHR